MGIAAYNAFVLWKLKHPEWKATVTHKRRDFLIALGKSLVIPHIQNRNRFGLHQYIQHSIRLILNEDVHPPAQDTAVATGRCFLCSRNRDRKCRNRCAHCNRFICREHCAFNAVCHGCEHPGGRLFQDDE